MVARISIGSGTGRGRTLCVGVGVRGVKEASLDKNGVVDVDGKAENYIKCRLSRSGCGTFRQEILADDLDWVSMKVVHTS